MYIHGKHARKVLFTKSALFCGMIMADMEAHHLDILIGGSAMSAEPPTSDISVRYLDYVVKFRFYGSPGEEFPEEGDEA